MLFEVSVTALLSCNFHLQCGHRFSKAEATLHGITNCTGRTPQQIRRYLAKFIEKDYHCVWISYIGSAFIHRKGLDLDKYLVNLLSPKVPLDELGLLIVARMYHWHIAVITNLYTWTTGWDLVASDCRVVFAYTGGINFQLVCDQVEDVPPLDPLGMVQPKKRSSSLSMDGPPKKCTKSTKKKRHTKTTTQTRTRRRCSKRIVKVPLPYRSVTMRPRGTKNSHKAAASAFKVSLDNILTNNRKQKATPKA